MSVVSKDSDPIQSPLKGVTGIILAGGRSSRYGRNKALVDLEGIPLIERVIGVMSSVFQRLILITNTPHEYAHLQLPMYGDLIKGLGPIGGIFTGLEVISDEAGFFVACDMPFLNRELVRYIVEVRDDFDAVVPRIQWKIETLHTLYNRRGLPFIKELIDSGEYQIIRFFDKIRIRYLEEPEIRAFDPKLRSFLNINRPEEMLHASKDKRGRS
jgi:molybdopterin-guanine dinucleotide biosynthesis protein A